MPTRILNSVLRIKTEKPFIKKSDLNQVAFFLPKF